MNNNWTPDQVTALLDMKRCGFTYSQIARSIGRTRSAVAGRVKRMGMAKPGRTGRRRGVAVDEVLLNKRRVIAEKVLAEGGNLDDFRRGIGIATLAGATLYLRRHFPDLHKQLRHNRPPWNGVNAAEALRRLRIIRAGRATGGSWPQVAREVGMSVSAVFQFLKRWAPDSVEQAIADLDLEADETMEAA